MSKEKKSVSLDRKWRYIGNKSEMIIGFMLHLIRDIATKSRDTIIQWLQKFVHATHAHIRHSNIYSYIYFIYTQSNIYITFKSLH